VAAIAKAAFTSEDRMRDVIRNYGAGGFGSLYPTYKGGRPPKFTLGQRREMASRATTSTCFSTVCSASGLTAASSAQALVGERALSEDDRRTATLRAVIDCVIAAAAAHQIDRRALARLAEQHHREDIDR
jgi:hypothetical protein